MIDISRDGPRVLEIVDGLSFDELQRLTGVSLLRVDCYAGGDGKLVRYYESNGFTRTEAFTGTDDWPGQILARRV